jgi:dipeptidyl aminopeptidase/acylaminoacyl peptidase
MRRSVALVASAVLALLLASAVLMLATFTLPEEARAAFPGKNGKIAFARYSDDTLQSEIYTMNADGSDQTNITNNVFDDLDPAWSPDGTKIAFSSSRDGIYSEVYTMNADGSNVTRLTNTSEVSEQGPAWSPDGTKIAFTVLGIGVSDDTGIYTMNADGSNRTQIVSFGGSPLSDPNWSPDGSRIAFSDGFGILTVKPDGSNLITLTDGDGFNASDEQPTWSPDGTEIAFWRRSSDNEIYKMNDDGSDQTKVITWGYSPAWSPDGTKIAFSHQLDGVVSDGIYSMNPDGSNVTRLSSPDPQEQDFAADWQPLLAQPPAERCTISGTNGVDYLRGTTGKDVICAKGGFDVVEGRGGNDILRGGPDSDSIVGGAGADELYGQKGFDSLSSTDGVLGNDSMNGGEGIDACIGDRRDNKTGCEAG